MLRTRTTLFLIVIACLTFAFTTGCKHSGVGVTNEGRILRIDIDAPSDMFEGEVADVKVDVSNSGPANIHDVYVEVEMPLELIVLEVNERRGLNVAQGYSADGRKLYTYSQNDLNIGENANINFKVRAAFGTRDRSGGIKVTAWQKELPNNKLIETKEVKLKR